ncbi:cell wall hydrolase [Salipaludibacillus sp. LMS25]|jgi:N-acetylmuramoyl-L-alanine amidase|uniref:cell wall hydrolase n=1 Tax=Salipaludibacillus sp. LMS25 TaxID=2924031 RepID=UPI0020D13ED9|nr:cell wall hydrolase [Salipaludibacillus sp. LMS25]UTR14612.1 cell wall hydrolase [Salipaludibacillus sp. LMS25]
MKQNHTKLSVIQLIIVTLFCVVSLTIPQSAEAFSDQVVQRGATGDDVVELQARMQYNGYYNGTIDGVFGWQTYWSVKEFQKQFGLEVVDGVVGDKTKAMLERATKYDKEFVLQNLREGRKFTYYGGVDKNIQRGPKGSKGQPKKQPKDDGVEKQQEQKQPKEEAPAPKEEPPAEEQQPQAKERPVKEEPEAPAEESPPEQQEPAEEPTPEGAEEPEEAPEEPEEAPAEPEETPEEPEAPEEPEEDPIEEIETPEEEEPEAQDDDINIEKAMNVPEGFSDNDIQLMAQAVYGEARGEPYEGQVAVAAVILNRIESPIFPNTVSDVIFEPLAFTAVADGQIWMEPNERARKAVMDAINGQDPSGNAIYYFNPQTATNKWIWSRPQIKQIGKHIFCE